MKTFYLILFIDILFLSGCSCHHTGKCVEKYYAPSSTYTSMMLIGKILVPQTNYVPEKWVIVINNKVDKYDFCVSRNDFENVHIGDSIIVDKHCYQIIK